MTPRARRAVPEDFADYLRLAGQVENWFGAMVAVPGFHKAVRTAIAAGTALCCGPIGSVTGAMLFGGTDGDYHLDWLVVDRPARRSGVGSALWDGARNLLITRLPATVAVVTFGAEHPAADAARRFYLRHGFRPAEPAPDGPEGGPRQWFRLRLTDGGQAAGNR